MKNIIDNITNKIVASLDNAFSQKATQETVAKIHFHISYKLEKRLEEKGFIFENKEDFLSFCESRLVAGSYDDLDGWLEFEIYIDNTVFLTSFHETSFSIYYDL